MPTDNDHNKNDLVDLRYPPEIYNKGLHKFWPQHAIKGSIAVIVTVAVIIILAYNFQLPAPAELAGNTALPDDGMYIPGPEWYFLFFLQPFWYLKGELASWQVIGTFVAPGLVALFLILVPFIFRRHKPVTGIMTRIRYLVPPLIVFALLFLGITKSGYQAKLQGCISCHNPSTGVRQNLPPMDVADFYKNNRQRQIDVGRYRASKSGTEGESVIGQEIETYKDANWQLRHIYEPTFTW